MKKLKRTLRLILGIALVAVGIITGPIPIIQGWMFLIPGLLILAEFFPPVRRLVDWGKEKAERARRPGGGQGVFGGFMQWVKRTRVFRPWAARPPEA